MSLATSSVIANRSDTTCVCFADQCIEWPLQLILHGIVTPGLGAVSLAVAIFALKKIAKTLPLVSELSPNKMVDFNCGASDVTDPSLMEDRVQRSSRKRLLVSVRTYIRVFCVYFVTKIMEFLKQEAAIFRYRYSLGYRICYVVLYNFFISRTVIVFIEVYAISVFGEIFIASLISKSTMTGSSWAIPILRVSGHPIYTGCVGLFSVAITLVSVTSYECSMCDEQLRLIQIQSRPATDYKDFLFTLDVTYHVTATFLSLLMFLLCFIGLFSGRKLADFCIPLQLRTKFFWLHYSVMVAGCILSFHQGMHAIQDLFKWFGGTKFYSDCLTDVVTTDRHCPADDYIYVIEQISISFALLKLIDLLN